MDGENAVPIREDEIELTITGHSLTPDDWIPEKLVITLIQPFKPEHVGSHRTGLHF